MILWKHLIHSWQAVPSVWKNRAAVRSASNKSHVSLVPPEGCSLGHGKKKKNTKNLKKGRADTLLSRLEVMMTTRLVSNYC